jgi:hypothetical protein
MYKVAPEHTVSKLEISLSDTSGIETSATISYEITAIGVNGEKFLEEFTEEWYAKFMEEWEMLLNHYLVTGEKFA